MNWMADTPAKAAVDAERCKGIVTVTLQVTLKLWVAGAFFMRGTPRLLCGFSTRSAAEASSSFAGLDVVSKKVVQPLERGLMADG